ncbi:hypothetical protein LOK49_LG07G02666 [Camellia lanceoleosa]|uniref:Uncharacterized protein n=1 Tax=Camellia lanceoleosa TaxID=1840588 RepID=A0ACC0H7W5_9ERIC|nr:hypothetical protein LOK49_LG07G02666 [Camellia lanceoleosa]
MALSSHFLFTSSLLGLSTNPTSFSLYSPPKTSSPSRKKLGFSLLIPTGMESSVNSSHVCSCDGHGCSKALPRCRSDHRSMDRKWGLL